MPSEIEGTGTLETQSTTIPQTGTALPPETPSGPEFNSIVPPDYQEKEWVKQIKDIPSMFKMMEDQKTALSRRPAGIPQDNAPPEEWEAFNKGFGVPEKPEEYQFKIEGKEFTEADRKFHELLRPLLKGAGVSKQQLAKLAPGFDKVMAELTGQAAKSEEALEAEFDTMADKAFGDRRDAVLTQTRQFIDKYAPAEMKQQLSALDNNALIALAAVSDGMRKEFVSEDALPNTTGEGGTGNSEAEKRERGRKLMASKEYQDPFHKDHDRVTAEVNALYGSMKGG